MELLSVERVNKNHRIMFSFLIVDIIIHSTVYAHGSEFYRTFGLLSL